MATDRQESSLPARNRVLRAVLRFVLAVAKPRSHQSRGESGAPDGVRILLTGTFYSENWIRSQLLPITLAQGVRELRFVSATAVPDIDGLTVIYPPRFLSKTIGAVPARLLAFAWHGVRYRPDLIGGFHLLINGLVALVVSRIARIEALYICVGGPTEVLGGGFATENRIFGQLAGPDEEIQRRLLRAVNAFDAIIVRGQSARSFFEEHGISTRIHTITAGVDSSVFAPSDDLREYDLVFLARLSDVKRIEIFLRIVEHLKQGKRSDIRALIIGDGPNRERAEAFISANGLANNVDMLGQRDDVAEQLNRARIFVLTSRSEGLSQAMVQAMLCGLPAVVANVGSLSDLVADGTSGFLIDDHGTAAAYAEPIMALLGDTSRLTATGSAARQSALRCSTENVVRKWDLLLQDTFNVGSADATEKTTGD